MSILVVAGDANIVSETGRCVDLSGGRECEHSE